jgi:hypothetical protein
LQKNQQVRSEFRPRVCATRARASPVDAARRTGNQRLADDFLKSPKMSGDRWLRQMQLLRRRRNFPALRNGQERSEKSQVEVVRVHSSLFRKASCLNALMSQYRYRYDSSSQLKADWKYPQIA